MIWKKLILLGDSNTQLGHNISGWVNSVSDLFQRKCDVINRGFSGYNTDHIKLILPKILSEFTPESVCGFVVMLGTNDSTEALNQIQHVPLKRFSENMNYILDYLINWGVAKDKLILISPSKIYDAKWIEIKGPGITHHDHLVTDYAREAIKIAKEKGVLYYDLNKAMEEYGPDYHELLSDGLHFSQKGGELLFRGILPILNENIMPSLNFNFPDWKTFEPNQQEIIQ